MSNRQLSPVSYRRFQPQPLLSDGLLAVERSGGDLERKVAMGLARLADEMGRRADEEAERAGKLAGSREALAGSPTGAQASGGGAFTTASVNGQAGHVKGAKGGVRVYTGSANERVKALLRQEEGFRPTPYWDVNAWRIGYGSDTVTGADGRSIRVKPGMKISREDAERDLDYRLNSREGANARRQLGDQWAGLGPDTQAALYSVAYNYGSLPDDVVAAVRSGDLGAVADAVAGLSSNKGRRSREAAMIRGGGKSYSSLPDSSAVAPVSVTLVEEPVEVTPGKTGSWRPSGRNTVYGRAYDVAGTRTYLEMVDLAMVENQQAIYEQYKDDPVMLEKALGEGLEADLRDNVLDEIAPEFTVSYRKRASSLLSKARAEQQERVKQQNRMEFLGRVEDLENRRSQRLAGLDLNDEAAASDLADMQASIDAHWDSAVARGIVDLDDAEKFKRSSRSEMTVGFYVRQASKMGAEDIKSMRADMTKDYSEGKLEGVTADDWAKIDQGLSAAESARRTQDEKANADLTKRGEDLARRVARGVPVTPEELARFQLDAGTAPKGREIVLSTLSRMRVSEAIRTMPIGQVEKDLKQLLGENATADDIDFARTTIAQHRKDIATDPLGVAERFGVLPVSEGLPLDGQIDPASVSAAFSERINAAKTAAQHFGTSPVFFRPGEAEQIEAAVKADPERGLDIAAGLVDAAGNDADRVLRELGRVAPAVSLSGSLIAAGGNRQAATDLIAGYGKTPEGKDYTDMPNTKRLPEARKISGEALAYTPSEINRLDQAAAAIARKRLYEAGIDPKKDDAKEIYERAYQEAAGATFANGVQYGGFADYDRGWRYSPKKVLLPPTVRADKFEDLMGALTDADLSGVKGKNGRAWTARDFQSAMPVAVKGGFAFATGDPAGSSPMFIVDESGKPIVLDLNVLRPVLEPRVPGAYR